MNFDLLLNEVKRIVNLEQSTNEKLFQICTMLKDNVEYYDWVGFYLVGNDKELILGPFVGEDTEHKLIKFGDGICGQAAQLEKTFVVQDVSKEDNYLSCSPKVASEIVVPIFKGSKIIGEIDIDSHVIAPFTDEDREFLQSIAEIVSFIL